MANRLNERLGRQLDQLLDLPPELAMDLPKITMVGNIELCIDNHRGIRRYETQVIEVDCRGGRLVIEGADMVLKSISQDDVQIYGVIHAVRYIEETL